MRLRVKVWIEKDGRMVFGDGLDKLLELVEETGSIARAAAGMGLAYREAWGRLKQAENALGSPLLSRHAGGPGGGGAELTAQGRMLRDSFRRAKSELGRETARLETLLPETTGGPTVTTHKEKAAKNNG
jgi:molybdate transport system regulatory protein